MEANRTLFRFFLKPPLQVNPLLSNQGGLDYGNVLSQNPNSLLPNAMNSYQNNNVGMRNILEGLALNSNSGNHHVVKPPFLQAQESNLLENLMKTYPR